MESIKETELNLQREVVTTVPNTWLVEAVNPSTGEKKMINIANYTSVVAEQMSYIEQKTGAGITDLNELMGIINKTAFYRFTVNSAPANTPINVVETRFYVEVANLGNSYVSQRFIGLKTKVVYQRFFTGPDWSDWQRIV